MAQHYLPMVRLAGSPALPRTRVRREGGRSPGPGLLLLLSIGALLLLALTVVFAVIYTVRSIDDAAIAMEIERAQAAVASDLARGSSADAQLAALLAANYSLSGARFAPAGETTSAEVSVAVPGSNGLVLAWTPRRFGTEMLYALGPMRLLASAFFLTGIAFLVQRLYAMTRELEARRRDAHELASRDPLTGLGNRLAFDERLQKAFDEKGARFALLYLDLNDFKRVNDSMGHGAGDEVLRRVAQRLRGFAQEGDLVARIGGDEFGILIGAPTDAEALAELASDIAAALAEPLRIGVNEITVGTSIGIAIAPIDATDAVALVDAADAALYRVKATDGPRFAFARGA